MSIKIISDGCFETTKEKVWLDIEHILKHKLKNLYTKTKRRYSRGTMKYPTWK